MLFKRIRILCIRFAADEENGGTLQKSKSTPLKDPWDNSALTRAVYSYLSNGENQLSFLKGDFIAVIGKVALSIVYERHSRTMR